MILATVLMIEAKEWMAARPNGTLGENARVESARIRDTGAGDTHGTAANVSVPPVNSIRANSSPPVVELGVYGETFPVAEKNLLEVIREKLQDLFNSGEIEKRQQAIASKAKEQMNRPAPVKGIVKTVTPKSFSYNPSIKAPYDLKDIQGKIFYRQGTTVNPLDTHCLRHPLLFVDGDDPEQVFWAIRQHKAAEGSQKPKIILVRGAPLALSDQLGLPIYFDQAGALVKKLGIGQVPARVSQAGKTLLVEEVNAGSKK